MSSTAIADTGESLISLLRKELGIVESQVALISPADAQGQDIRLSLFLYSIIEVPELKNAPRIQLNDKESQSPPLSLNLQYMLTAYPPTGMGGDVSDQSLEAHRVLGEAMRVFYDNGIISGTKLIGNWSNVQALRLSLNPITLEDMTRIWSVFPNTIYRPSVCYLATPAKISSARIEGATRIVEKDMEHDQNALNPNQGQNCGN